jgi:hypothetical protein
MRPMLLFAVLPAFLYAAAPELRIVRPTISQMDGGEVFPPGFDHSPGETFFFACRVSGFTKNDDEQMDLKYSVQAFDPNGVPLTELYENEMKVEVSPQDKEWLPKISTEVQIPPLIASGTYKIVVKAEDVQAKAKTELAVPFQVRGAALEPSDTVVVRNFRFYRSEEDTVAVEKAIYNPGDSVWARFDITGYKYGPKNKIDVSYLVSLVNSEGKVLYTQPQPAVEQSESFYPKRYVPASMALNLQKNIRPGEYTIGVSVKDAVGSQAYEGKFTFTVQGN